MRTHLLRPDGGGRGEQSKCVQVTIWGGIFPIVVNWWAALGLTVYYVATNNVLFYVRNVQHVQALWFANTANSILWWTYVKACTRAVMTLVGASSITFKTTLKVGLAGPILSSVSRDSLSLPATSSLQAGLATVSCTVVDCMPCHLRDARACLCSFAAMLLTSTGLAHWICQRTLQCCCCMNQRSFAAAACESTGSTGSPPGFKRGGC